MMNFDCGKARTILIDEIAYALMVAGDFADREETPPTPDEALDLVHAFLAIGNRSRRVAAIRVLRELVRRGAPARSA